MVLIKKKLKEYFLVIKDKFFTYKGLFIIFILCTVQLISQYTNHILRDFLIEFYPTTKDSYIIYLFLISCRIIFIILQIIILYEFTKKKSKKR